VVGWELMRLDFFEKMRLFLEFLDVDIDINMIENYPNPGPKDFDQ
jgi:hypothetical protein